MLGACLKTVQWQCLYQLLFAHCTNIPLFISIRKISQHKVGVSNTVIALPSRFIAVIVRGYILYPRVLGTGNGQQAYNETGYETIVNVHRLLLGVFFPVTSQCIGFR